MICRPKQLLFNNSAVEADTQVDMKLKTRRIEITASRRSVAIIRDDATGTGESGSTSMLELKSWNTTVEPDSEEGRKLIIETIAMLEEIIESR